MIIWDGERVLVTGSASFIGSHLVEDLLTEGGRLIEISFRKTTPC